MTLPKVYPYLNKALELDPNSAQAHYVAAILAVWIEWDWEKGEREFLKSIELNPNDALCRMYYAHLLMILRRTEEANKQASIGLELDPSLFLVHDILLFSSGFAQLSILIGVQHESHMIFPLYRVDKNE